MIWIRRVETTFFNHFSNHRWASRLECYVPASDCRSIRRCRISTMSQDTYLIGVYLTLIIWLSMDMWLLGKRGKLQFGGRDRQNTGMNTLLSMSTVFKIFSTTTTSTFAVKFHNIPTTEYSSWSAGYGQAWTAGNIQLYVAHRFAESDVEFTVRLLLLEICFIQNTWASRICMLVWFLVQAQELKVIPQRVDTTSLFHSIFYEKTL